MSYYDTLTDEEKIKYDEDIKVLETQRQSEIENGAYEIFERRCFCKGWSLESRQDGRCQTCGEAYDKEQQRILIEKNLITTEDF